MTQISPKKERCPKNSYFDKQIKNFHKSKIDGLQKLSTRAPRFYDFLHFKGWPFINHKISQQIFGKFRFLNLRSLKYIIIVQKINISTIGNFFIFFLGFQTLWTKHSSLVNHNLKWVNPILNDKIYVGTYLL